jgi:hypothetical protein
MQEVGTPIRSFKVGDVIKAKGRFCVVTNTLRKKGMHVIDVLCSDGSSTSWPETAGRSPVLYARVGRGCGLTFEALNLFVKQLND